MLIPINKLLKKRLKKFKLNSQIEAVKVCEASQDVIKNFFSEKIVKTPPPRLSCRFKNGTLKLRGAATVYLSEIRLNEEVIREKINNQLGSPLVKKIIF